LNSILTILLPSYVDWPGANRPAGFAATENAHVMPASEQYASLFDWSAQTVATIPSWMTWGWLVLLMVFLLYSVFMNFRLRKKTRELYEEMQRHKATAQRARRGERYVTDIFNNMNDYLFFHDLDGNFRELNASALRDSSFSVEQWRKLNLRDIVPEPNRSLCDAYLERIRRDGTLRGYLRITSGQDRELILEYNNSLVNDSAGNPIGVRGIARNITRQRQTQIALRQSEKKYRTILDSIEDGYYEVDLSGNMTFFNHSMMRHLGFTADEIRGKNYREFVDASDRDSIYQTFNYVFRTGKPVKGFDWKLIRNDQGVCHVEASVSLNVGQNNAPIGFRGIVRDITQRFEAEKKRIELEAQLRQAQKLESIGTLAGGIAHDFNNILFPIMGYTEMTLQELPEESRTRSNLEKVLKSADRAKALVQQILTFSRQSADPVIEPVRIQPVVRETIKLLRNTVPRTIEIQDQVENDAGRVLINIAQFHQVIMNLCTNAFQAMEEQATGTLTVTLKQIDITPETSPGHRHLTPGSYVMISVADTGTGIAGEHIEKIFEPYFTTKPQDKGTGLGLSVSYGIVRNAGGMITVESLPGVGSRFDIYFPLAGEPGPDAEIVGHAGPLPTGNEQILLVDDEHRIVELEKEILESLGYQTYPRTSSIEALEAFRHDPDRYDLVLTDQTMPNMTGLELARTIHNIRPDIPIVLCTGYSEKVTPEKINPLGIRALLMKPISRSDMAVTLRRILDESKIEMKKKN